MKRGPRHLCGLAGFREGDYCEACGIARPPGRHERCDSVSPESGRRCRLPIEHDSAHEATYPPGSIHTISWGRS